MTLIVEPPSLGGPANGGMPARRAIVRWAWRMLRRGWRQQAVVALLLALAVLGAVVGGAAAVNLAPRPDARFGRADHLVQLDGGDPAALARSVALARSHLGTVELVGRRFVPVPGSSESLELRAEDPHGVYGSPLLAVRSGRFPNGASETALTDGAARMLGLRVGGVLTAGGEHRTVVGIVENPRDLRDEFALLPPGAAGRSDAVTVLAKASADRFDAYRQASTTPLLTETVKRGGQAAGGVLAATTLLLLLVSLVAAAAFAVVAQRRLRELGMLAAIGATRRHLRLVMVANGAAVGAIASAAGLLAGIMLWIPVSRTLETPAQHRVSPAGVPWALALECAALAVVMATAAAWWPARGVARIPVVRALSARPPAPRPARRSTALAVLFLIGGVACLALARQRNPLLIVTGTLGTVLGVLLTGPLALSLLGAAAGRAPVAVRLAVRDLARHRARSAAALAAISLALGLPIAVIITSSAARDTAATGNLSDRQLVIRIGRGDDSVVPLRSDRDLAALSAQVDRIAARLPGARVVPLDMPVDPAIRPQPGFADSQGGQPVADLGIPPGSSDRPDSTAGRTGGALRSVPLYVETPALLAHLGIDPASVDPATDLITGRHGTIEIPSVSRPETLTRIQRIRTSAYSSDPTSVLTARGLERRHWKRIRTGWLVESARPLSDAQLVAARHDAAAVGVNVESRRGQASLARARLGAVLAGMLLALGVLAMTVGLIRLEGARDLRVLTATGASPRIRRALTAATAASLALLGVVLGGLGAYAGLFAGYLDDPGHLGHPPWAYLASVGLGVPLLAAVTGWAAAGREPPALARSPLD
ncbi:FtsX-like permease family protein [Actinomadura rupiterrae]|uniref:FtsX-like permease family protein n=1 Tax=Actinomadura rupiterrae TaxID=559627 RepID=UPI0020A3547F|nr:FtsX-like permease family protein [Actinomadura rupiterrae]MCP2341350.1 putative ABC transport system permease protein [Actinomadura rupiterrae]